MAYTPSNKNESDILKAQLRADTAIAADSYNLTPDFFEKNQKIFERINDSVNSIVKTYGFNNKNNSDIVNPLKNYNRLLYNTIDRRSIQSDFMNIKESNLDSSIRSIANENVNNDVEEGIINSFQKITSESFSLMEEYRTACNLIPELKRVLKLIVRDVVNPNEVTKRSIHDVYSISDEETEEDTDDVDQINKIIDKNITEKYKIEEKLQLWLYEALVAGAKPILVLPYKDIIKQAISLSSVQNKDGAYNINKSSQSGSNVAMSMEDLDNVYNEMSFEDFEKFGFESIDPFKVKKELNGKNILEPKGVDKIKYNYKSQEDIEEYTRSYENFVNDIIDDNMVDSIYENGMESILSTYENEKRIADEKINDLHVHGVESNDDKIYDTVNSIKNMIDNIEKNNNDDRSEDEKREDKEKENEKLNEQYIKNSIKKQLGEFVCRIDKNIDIVNNDYSALNLGKSNLMNRMTKKKMDDKFIDGINVKDKDEINSIAEDFDGEVLITELNPEYVIPVSIGSQHIQYYIYEAEAYSGPTQSPSRRSTSFASIIASTGFGNDSAVISASNGVSLVPNDPALSSVFNPANFGNINMPISGNDLLENNKSTEILKQIVFKTLSKRMCDPSLSDNKSFTDSIMNLVRQGYIVNRQVKFTCVPATNIVYFSHDIDDKGLPHSILDGTLLQIYMYLAGIVSMTMNIVNKSSDKEKLEVNMGMSHQIGMTLMEIQKQLSTRNIHVKSFFNNIGSVLRNVATFSRYSIPVVEGEKLYDINTVQGSNEQPIDTDFIEKRLSSILSSIPAPPAILNMMQEAEFSRSIINQNLEYRNSIIEKQFKFGKDTTKLYRLIALYSKLSKPVTLEEKEIQSETKDIEEEDNNKQIKIKNINVRFTSPMYLNMTNIAETFTNVEPVIDTFAKYLFGENADTKLEQFMIQKFKKECIKIFAGNIDLAYIEKIANNIKSNPYEGLTDEVKKNIISKQTESIISGEIDTSNSSGESSSGSDSGDDDFGGF